MNETFNSIGKAFVSSASSPLAQDMIALYCSNQFFTHIAFTVVVAVIAVIASGVLGYFIGKKR